MSGKNFVMIWVILFFKLELFWVYRNQQLSVSILLEKQYEK